MSVQTWAGVGRRAGGGARVLVCDRVDARRWAAGQSGSGGGEAAVERDGSAARVADACGARGAGVARRAVGLASGAARGGLGVRGVHAAEERCGGGVEELNGAGAAAAVGAQPMDMVDHAAAAD